MRSERHRAGSRKNKPRSHHGRKRKTDQVTSRLSDRRKWYMGDFHVLCAVPNQEPTSTDIRSIWGPTS